MKDILNSVARALEEENWYAALFVALTLPDICAALEHEKSNGDRYAEWFEANLPQYKEFLSGNDCYALRCALLHEGRDDVSDQKKKEVIEHCVLMSSGSHMNLFRDCVINDVKTSFLEVNVQKFCNDLCFAVTKWLESVASDPQIQQRLATNIKIHNPGYVHMGVIRFG